MRANQLGEGDQLQKPWAAICSDALTARKQTTGACTEARDRLSIHQRRQDIKARRQKACENEDKGVNGDHVGDEDVPGLGCHYVEAEDGGDTAVERRASRYDTDPSPEGEPEEK